MRETRRIGDTEMRRLGEWESENIDARNGEAGIDSDRYIPGL